MTVTVKIAEKQRMPLALFGFTEGLRDYRSSVQKKSQDANQVTLVFPESVEIVSSSYLQGLLRNEFFKFGLHGTLKKFKVEGSSALKRSYKQAISLAFMNYQMDEYGD